MQTRMSAMVKSIRKNGEMKRATWDPANIVGLSGWPLRNYLWWREKKGYDGPENFCHFMRVAMIWAPLRRVDDFMSRHVLHVLSGVLALYLTWMIATLTRDWDLPTGLMFVIIPVVVVAGLLSAMYYTGVLYEREWGTVWMAKRSRSVRVLITLVGLPVFALLMVAAGILQSIEWIFPLIGRAIKWFFAAHPSFASWLRPWVIVAAAIVVLAPFASWALVALQILVPVVSTIGVMIAGGWWADRRTVARKAREESAKQQALQEERQMFFSALFSVLHPKWERDEARYAKWLTRYKAWYLEETGNHVDTLRLTKIAYSAPWQARLAHYSALSLYEERRREAVEPVVQPKPKKARRRIIPLGVVTFFQLVWAFVVTNKWKICPIISIPTPQES